MLWKKLQITYVPLQGERNFDRTIRIMHEISQIPYVMYYCFHQKAQDRLPLHVRKKKFLNSFYWCMGEGKKKKNKLLFTYFVCEETMEFYRKKRHVNLSRMLWITIKKHISMVRQFVVVHKYTTPFCIYWSRYTH